MKKKIFLFLLSMGFTMASFAYGNISPQTTINSNQQVQRETLSVVNEGFTPYDRDLMPPAEQYFYGYITTCGMVVYVSSNFEMSQNQQNVLMDAIEYAVCG